MGNDKPSLDFRQTLQRNNLVEDVGNRPEESSPVGGRIPG